MSSRNGRFAGALAALALVLVPAAIAAEKYQIKFNAADQAAAKAITLQRSDLGAGWTGGPGKPDLTPDEDCPTKKADLVVTGAAKSEFQSEGVLVSSESNVLKTAAMARADLQRTAGSARWWACGKRAIAKEKAIRLVSFGKIAFPKLGQYSARYRVVIDYGTAGSSVRVVMDIVAVAKGRSEVALIVTAPYKNRTAVDAAGRRLAGLLVGRIRA